MNFPIRSIHVAKSTRADRLHKNPTLSFFMQFPFPVFAICSWFQTIGRILLGRECLSDRSELRREMSSVAAISLAPLKLIRMDFNRVKREPTTSKDIRE